jgi:Flp pilus assembly protein TadD
MKRTLLPLLLACTLWAGTSLNCLDFASAPGSLFAIAKQLSAPTQRKAEVLATLVKAADEDKSNLSKQFAAGFLAEALRQTGQKRDGMPHLFRALELAPKNAEVHLILALAYVSRDNVKAKLHRQRARELAAKDSLTAKNLELSSRFFGD